MTVTKGFAKKEYVGAGIILMRLTEAGPRYLVLKGMRSGVWSFSKGHPEAVDRGAPLRTAVRETFEETGYVNSRDYHIVGDAIRFGKRPYWLGVVDDRDGSPPMKLSRTEHTEAAWLSRDEIANLEANTDVRAWARKAMVASNFTRLLSTVQRSLSGSDSNIIMHVGSEEEEDSSSA